MKKIVISSLAAASALLVIGCGGGSNPTDNPSNLKNGYYYDSAVSGVKYKCGDREGTTNSEGKFKYKESDGNCAFSLAGIPLKTISTDTLKNNNGILFEDNVTVARFLQSLDFDGNASNGIKIDGKVTEQLVALDVSEIPKTPEELNSTIVKSISVQGFKGKVPTDMEVKKHLEETQNTIFGGDNFESMFKGKTFYAVGQYDNDLAQTWVAKIFFESDMSQLHFTGLAGLDKKETSFIKIDHIYPEHRYFETKDQSFKIESFKKDYIEAVSYEMSGATHIRLYYKESNAQSYYNNLQKSVKNILNGKKFYIVYEFSNADGISFKSAEGTFNYNEATFTFKLKEGTRGTKHLSNYKVNSVDIDGDTYKIDSITDKEITFTNNNNDGVTFMHLFYNKLDAANYIFKNQGGSSSSASVEGPVM